MAPALIRYSTSRLASIPARPRPCCPTTWATDAWCANVPPKRCMNSARSESWKYCSRNYGGSQSRYCGSEDIAPRVRARDTILDHRIGDKTVPLTGQAPWGGFKDPGAPACLTWAQAWLLLVVPEPTSFAVKLYRSRSTDGVTPRCRPTAPATCGSGRCLKDDVGGKRCSPPTVGRRSSLRRSFRP